MAVVNRRPQGPLVDDVRAAFSIGRLAMKGRLPSSLASNGDLSHCPRRSEYWYQSESTDVCFRARCGANFCPWCAPINAAQTARAMALAAPQRMIRLSLVPHQFRRTQLVVASLQKWARRNYGTFEMAFHVEPNPKGTGNHIHAWQHGPSKIPQDKLQEACERVGLGYPDIRRWRDRGGKTGYGLKGIGYGMKHEDLEMFLSLNGGRLVHHSRGFFRDGANGERLTLGEAKRRAMPEPEEPGPWVLKHESQLRR